MRGTGSSPKATTTGSNIRLGDHQTSFAGEFLSTPLHFSIIVTGWNCEDQAEACLQSIVTQEGSFDYDIFWLDDASDDHTREVIQPFANNPRLHLFRNSTNRGAACCRWQLLGEIRDPQSICVLVDMDDQLAPGALRIVANVYRSNPDCWLTYGNFIGDSGKVCQVAFYDFQTTQKKLYRSQRTFRCPHLRTFRHFLLEGLTDADFQDDGGNWLLICTDVALMWPLLERCRPHNIVTVDRPIYVYNRNRTASTLARFGNTRKQRTKQMLSERPVKPHFEP